MPAMYNFLKNKILPLLFIVVLAAAIGVYFLFFANRQMEEAMGPPPEEPLPSLRTLGEGEYDLLALNYVFSPEELVVPKGKPVKIFVDNIGEHTFTIDKLGVNVPLRKRFEVIEFTPEKAGTFEFYCSMPGHKEAGMVGMLRVE